MKIKKNSHQCRMLMNNTYLPYTLMKEAVSISLYIQVPDTIFLQSFSIILTLSQRLNFLSFVNVFKRCSYRTARKSFSYQYFFFPVSIDIAHPVRIFIFLYGYIYENLFYCINRQRQCLLSFKLRIIFIEGISLHNIQLIRLFCLF